MFTCSPARASINLSSDSRATATRAPRATRATQGLRARGGTESLFGLAWFGSIWDGILGGSVRVRFSHRESTSPDPLQIIRTVDQSNFPNSALARI